MKPVRREFRSHFKESELAPELLPFKLSVDEQYGESFKEKRLQS